MKVLVFHLPTSWISGFCDTPIWQLSGHAGAKTNIQKREWLFQNCVELGASNGSTFDMDKQYICSGGPYL